DLSEVLDLPEPPARMECFDISHTGGEGTVASCVVFGPEGPLKKEYRRFNITGVSPGDDYAALRQALERRYKHVRQGEVPAPDLLLIDGGAGQISQVHAVLAELGYGDLTLVGVAKGPDRRPGQERLFVYGVAAPVTPEAHSPAARLIQRIRDEAHRFAITGHRRRRARRYNESVLEVVPGLGPAKRRALLKHFGGLQGVMRAGIADLTQAAGIGATLARSLYDHLHPGSEAPLMPWNLPNTLTWGLIARIPPIVLLFYMPNPWADPAAGLMFAAAGITDSLDGYFARRFGQISRLGAFLDPVADKLIVAVALVLLVSKDARAVIVLTAIIIIGREITISALREWMAEIGARRKVAVSQLGKYKTILQITGLSLMLYRWQLFGLPIYRLGVGLTEIAAAATLVSMAAYLRIAWPELKR